MRYRRGFYRIWEHAHIQLDTITYRLDLQWNECQYYWVRYVQMGDRWGLCLTSYALAEIYTDKTFITPSPRKPLKLVPTHNNWQTEIGVTQALESISPTPLVMVYRKRVWNVHTIRHCELCFICSTSISFRKKGWFILDRIIHFRKKPFRSSRNAMNSFPWVWSMVIVSYNHYPSLMNCRDPFCNLNRLPTIWNTNYILFDQLNKYEDDKYFLNNIYFANNS